MSYQTILLVIQGLPRQWQTVDRFSTIIGAPFRGEARRPGVIIDAFNEFWGSTYADVNKPEGGWPTPIKAALQASRQGDEAPATNQDHENPQNIDHASHGNQDSRQEGFGEIPSEIAPTGDTRLDKTLDAAFDHPIQPYPRDTPAISKPPSTPRKERRNHVSTPPRRHKTTMSPKTLRTLGTEPRSPLTDLRKKNGSSATCYTSPTPKPSDKENVGPKPLPDMFTSVLGKRKMEPTIEDSTSYVKRRISSSRSLKTARTPVVAGDMVAASENPTETAGDETIRTPSKKRKSEVFVGVVVPTMKEVMLRRRHSAPLKEVAKNQPPGDPAITGNTALRKSRSAARIEVVDPRNRDLEASPRKKMRTVRSGEPIVLMGDFPVAGSGKCAHLHPRNKFETDHTAFWQNPDDSIVAVDPSAKLAQLSSDDDPMKLGRYTPRVLVSPVLTARRLNEERWDEADAGSDDSVEPNSPTRDVIERRKKMGWPSAKRAAGGGRGVLVS